MIVNGYELIGEWKVSNMGWTALAVKGGRKYFLKRYGDRKMPRHNASTSAALYEKQMAQFNDFKANRIAINEALGVIAGTGGNIIAPCDWFMDDICFVEASEFVDGLLNDEAIMALPTEQKMFIMLTAAKALKEIHGRNIVHSDLKRTNLMAWMNPSGRAVAKVIDFDRSYFVGKIHEDEFGGDQLFMSPELIYCLLSEFDEDAMAQMTQASDVFSLGLVYYNYFTSCGFPKITGLTGRLAAQQREGKTVYCGEALLNDCTLEVGTEIPEQYLRALIANMLYKDYDKRPTASMVMDVLKNKTVLPVDESQGIRVLGMSAPASPAAAPARPATAPTAAPAATAAPSAPIRTGYCAPWPEHGIKLNESVLSANGYVACEQVVQGGKNCYKLYKADGSSRLMTMDSLKMVGWASPAGAAGGSSASSAGAATSSGGTVSSFEAMRIRMREERERAAAAASAASAPTVEVSGVSDETWDTDSDYVLDNAAAVAAGYKGVTKAERNGKKCYVLLSADGSQRPIMIGQLLLMGFAHKK